MTATTIIMSMCIIALLWLIKRTANKASKLDDAIHSLDKMMADATLSDARKIRAKVDTMRRNFSTQQSDMCHTQMTETQQAVRCVSDLAKECNARIAGHEQ